jgi:hypothetical protein
MSRCSSQEAHQQSRVTGLYHSIAERLCRFVHSLQAARVMPNDASTPSIRQSSSRRDERCCILTHLRGIQAWTLWRGKSEKGVPFWVWRLGTNRAGSPRLLVLKPWTRLPKFLPPSTCVQSLSAPHTLNTSQVHVSLPPIAISYLGNLLDLLSPRCPSFLDWR